MELVLRSMGVVADAPSVAKRPLFVEKKQPLHGLQSRGVGFGGSIHRNPGGVSNHLMGT